ncbi:MAG: Deoxyuridine 5'-triphosphate nucleotidohydrolase Dut [Parcubacteria group bacterium GW2011_GWF2_38_76]|nr:MAG: Deoxyuridine 5'-triphosphate nucleotidohydrolase Dut [Parcubacteria group bacterium GW2011_GWF2_38_76]HBM45947.1 dUTP diphosphatase [Patescibacteria group bacterium]
MFKKLKVKRLDNSIELPRYQTGGSVAFDFMAREDAEIKPKEISYVPLNVCIKIPKNHTLLMAPRSSLHKKGVLLANSIGVFDEDFCGDGDEYRAALYNFSDKTVKIEKGDRLTQGFIVPIVKVEWKEVPKMNICDRGGFGSTGKK